mgnify:CR=1 FL=1
MFSNWPYLYCVFSSVFLVAHDSPPRQEELVEFSGHVSKIKEIREKYGRKGFEFWLTDEVKKFRFEAYGVEYNEVLESLRSTEKVDVRILAHPEGSLSWFSGLRTFPVYAIKVSHGPEISYKQLSKSWLESNSLARKISGIGAVIGACFLSMFFYFRAQSN